MKGQHQRQRQRSNVPFKSRELFPLGVRPKDRASFDLALQRDDLLDPTALASMRGNADGLIEIHPRYGCGIPLPGKARSVRVPGTLWARIPSLVHLDSVT